MRPLVPCLFVIGLVATAMGSDVSQFRGPDGTGVYSGAGHPAEWSDETNIAWKQSIPGHGWSAPAVVGQRVFLTSAVTTDQTAPKNMMDGARNTGMFGGRGAPKSYQFMVHCLDLKTGKIAWSTTVANEPPKIPKHASNTHATESPAADGQHVYAWFGTAGVLACLDHSGKEVWQKALPVYDMASGFGTGSSLRLHKGKLILQRDNEEDSRISAFQASDGELLWEVERACSTSWATPFIWQAGGREEVIACGAGVVVSYDFNTGKELWRLEGISSSFSASPTGNKTHVCFGSGGPGSGSPFFAVKAGAKGDVSLLGDSSNESVWETRNSEIGMASPLLLDDLIYIPGRGRLRALDVKTGEVVYRERIANSKTFVGSPWTDGSKIFLTDEDGSTFVVKSGRTFALLGTNQIDDLVWSTPTVAGKSLLIRGVNGLYCVRAGG